VNALELTPAVYDQWRAALREGWRVTDPDLLEQCLPRIAEAHGRPARETAPLDDRGRAAAEYVDQYVLDQHGVTAAHREALARHLEPWALNDFAYVVWLHDSDMRARVLLQIDEDAGEREPAEPPPLADGRLSEFPTTDPAFGARLASFMNAVHSQKALDLETSELARLRNAIHQQCLL
jgi:hypothetical protein